MLPKGHLSNGIKKITIKKAFREVKKKNNITYTELEELSGISEFKLKKLANYGEGSDEDIERLEGMFNTKLY